MDLTESNVFVEALEQVLFRVLFELSLKYTWLVKLINGILIISLDRLVLLTYKRLQRVCARAKRIVIVGLILINVINLAGALRARTESRLSKHLNTMDRILVLHISHLLIVDHDVGNINLLQFGSCSASAFTSRSETLLCSAYLGLDFCTTNATL